MFGDVPQDIQQLYSIHTLAWGSMIPFAWGLLPHKTKEMYNRMFTKLKEHQVIVISLIKKFVRKIPPSMIFTNETIKTILKLFVTRCYELFLFYITSSPI